MFNQKATANQSQVNKSAATELLSNFRKSNEGAVPKFPVDFNKELELAIIATVMQTSIPQRAHAFEENPKITIDLDRKIGNKITELFYDYCKLRGNSQNMISMTDFVMGNCNLYKILEILYFDHRECRLYHTENQDRSIDYKLELVTKHANILELLESRLVYWVNIEASERAVIEMREIHDWVLAQKDNDVYKKILVTLTEIGTDVKSLMILQKIQLVGWRTRRRNLKQFGAMLAKLKLRKISQMNNRVVVPEQPIINWEYFKQFHNVPEKKTNILEFTLDSMGSTQRYLTEVEYRIRQPFLVRDLDIAKKVIAQPEKRFYIETLHIGEGAFPRIYDIQPDGSFIYNERLSNYVLNRSHDIWFIRRIFSQAIMA